MDIRNWSLDQIMQLPDHLFGRRYLIYCTARPGAAATVYDISEIALPEVCVVWELLINATVSATKRFVFRIALGDQLPANAAAMDVLEPLISGLGEDGREPRVIQLKANTTLRWNKLRFPVRTAGRRLVCSFENTDVASALGTVGIVISSVPREIPDCLISV